MSKNRNSVGSKSKSIAYGRKKNEGGLLPHIENRIKKVHARKTQEMRKYLREHYFYKTITYDHIDKNLQFLMQTMDSQKQFEDKLKEFRQEEESSHHQNLEEDLQLDMPMLPSVGLDD